MCNTLIINELYVYQFDIIRANIYHIGSIMMQIMMQARKNVAWKLSYLPTKNHI